MSMDGGQRLCLRLVWTAKSAKVSSANGTWLSLVERSVWDREVAGSNPVVPTISLQARSVCSWPFSCVLCPRRDLRPAPSARTVTLPRDIDADSPCHLGETLRPRPRASFVARRHHQRQSQVQEPPGLPNTILWQGTPPFMPGLECMANPTYRAFRGSPIIRATCPYVATRPSGTCRTMSYARWKKSLPSIICLTSPDVLAL